MRKKIKNKKSTKRRQKGQQQQQRTGAVAVSRWFFPTLNTFFTCSGGEFCPGLGEEELDEVAAAGLVGLCCFAREEKEQEISLN